MKKLKFIMPFFYFLLTNSDSAASYIATPFDEQTVLEYAKINATIGSWTLLPNGTTEFHEGLSDNGVPGFSLESFPDAFPHVSRPFGLHCKDGKVKNLAKLIPLKSQLIILDMSLAYGITDEAIQIIASLDHISELILSDTSLVTPQGLNQLANLKTLKSLTIIIQKPDLLKSVFQLDQLIKLNISYPPLTISRSKPILDLSDIKSLTRLQVISINNANVINSSFSSIESLKYLTHLSCAYTSINSSNITRFAQRNSKLVFLDLTNIKCDDLTGLSAAKNLSTLILMSSTLNSKAFTQIGLLVSLKKLDLSHINVNDQDLIEIIHLTQLQYLNISWTNVSEEGLRVLRPLKNLLFLGMTGGDLGGYHFHEAKGAKINDKSLQILREIGLLHALHLAQGLKGIRPTSNADVISIDLSLTLVSSNGIEALQIFTNLKSIVLPCNMTDQGVRHLSKLTKLCEIYFSGGNLSEKVFPVFSTLPDLTQLILSVSGISSNQFAHLQELLPKCRVTR